MKSLFIHLAFVLAIFGSFDAKAHPEDNWQDSSYYSVGDTHLMIIRHFQTYDEAFAACEVHAAQYGYSNHCYNSSSRVVAGWLRHSPTSNKFDYLQFHYDQYYGLAIELEKCEQASNPCSIFDGAKTQLETDFQSYGANALEFKRQYNSKIGYSGTLGLKWKHNYSYSLVRGSKFVNKESKPEYGGLYRTKQEACESGWTALRSFAYRGTLISSTSAYDNGSCKIQLNGKTVHYLDIVSTNPNYVNNSATENVTLYRNGTKRITFEYLQGLWVNNFDPRKKLSYTESVWTYTDANGNKEKYNDAGKLIELENRQGLIKTLTYDLAAAEGGDDDLETLDKVSNGLGLELSFQYDSIGRVIRLVTPNGNIDYEYGSTLNVLTKVTYEDNSTKEYVYENGSFPDYLTGIIDENSVRYSTWAYNSQGQATLSEHPGGSEAVTFSYLSSGQTRTTDVLGAERTYQFEIVEGAQKVSSVTGDRCLYCNHGDFQSKTFNDDGQTATSVDFNGNETQFLYTNHRLTTKTKAAGTAEETVETTSWDETLGLPTSKTKGSRRADYTYDEDGNRLTETITDTSSDESRTTAFTYNTAGLVLIIDGPRIDVNDVTSFEYDLNNRLTKITNALGHTTEITNYNVVGLPTTILHPNDIIEERVYDLRGRLVSRSYNGATTGYQYDNIGQLTKITYPTGVAQSFEYNDSRRLIAIQDNEGNKVEYGYDLAGNKTSTAIKNITGLTVYSQLQEFDKFNQLVKTVSGEGIVNNFEYDSKGNLSKLVDGLTNTNHSTIDALDRITKRLDPLNGETILSYDNHNNLVQVTDAENKSTNYVYNAFGEVTLLTSPDSGVTSYVYDEAGNVVSKTDARGVTSSYTYDAINRKLTETYNNSSENISYTYDETTNENKGVGLLTSVTDESGTTHYKYNGFGQVVSTTQVIQGNSFSIDYAYDENSRLTQVVYPSGRIISYVYNIHGQLSEITSNYQAVQETIVSNIKFSPFGPISGMTLGNGGQIDYQFDSDYRVTNKTDSIIDAVSYVYSLTNNITNINHVTNTVNNQSLAYDALSRLLVGTGEYGDIGYSYDKVGNRLTKDENGNLDSYVYELDTHRLESINGFNNVSNTFDSLGNALTKNSLAFTYSQRNRMATLTKPGMNVNYLYNFKGERVEKLVDGVTTQFVFDMQGKLIAESDEAGGIASEYIFLGNSPIAKVDYVKEDESLVQEITVNDENVGISITDVGSNPILFVGPATSNDTEPGVMAVSNVSQASADIKFSEWDYLDGVHGDESVSVMALPEGIHLMADGSIWEVGTVSITNDRVLYNKTFDATFAGVPTLILTPQTNNDGAAFSVRAKNLTASSFSLRMNEEEITKNSSHATEVIGYVAVYSPNSTGTAELGGIRFDYELASNSLKHQWKTIANYSLKVEEEQSKDTEINHTNETVNVLIIDGFAFAQDVLTKGGDSSSIRRNNASPIPASTISSSSVSFYHNSHLGTPEAMTDANQNIVWQASYTPFGKATVSIETVENNIRFPGQYFDSESGLHYNYFRDYDPEIGRYIQSDPIGLAGGINTYGYAYQNPISNIDPDGRAVIRILSGLIFGTINGFLNQQMNSYSSCLTTGEAFWSGFAGGFAGGLTLSPIAGSILSGGITSGLNTHLSGGHSRQVAMSAASGAVFGGLGGATGRRLSAGAKEEITLAAGMIMGEIWGTNLNNWLLPQDIDCDCS